MNYYSVMATYNQWMNQKLYELCADIPDLERKGSIPLFKILTDKNNLDR